MKLSLLFGIFPPQIYDSIVSNSIGGIQYAADALQKSIIAGLGALDVDFNIFNVPFLGSYPQRYSEPKIDDYDFVYDIPETKSRELYNVGFWNIAGYKFFSRYYRAYKSLLNASEKNSLGDVLLIYSIHLPFLKAAVDIKRKIPNLKLVLIVPDLPEYMAASRSYPEMLLMKGNLAILERLYKYVDGYVLLSKYMTERLPVNSKPFTVVEGIYNPQDTPECAKLEKDSTSYILYTGTLAKRYGVLNLVKAFMQLKRKDINLVICGDGDSKEEITRLSKIDSRIVYKGLVKRDEALRLQQNAMLLVNPRTPEGEFTKYSFPSKTMEYLASGVPTLLYRLPGIPEEYYNYCFSMDDLSLEALTDKLESIIEMSRDELTEIGARACQFIYEKKSPRNQSMKIFKLISEL